MSIGHWSATINDRAIVARTVSDQWVDGAIDCDRQHICHATHVAMRDTFGDSLSGWHLAVQDFPASYVSVKMSPWAAPEPDLPPPGPRRTKAMMTATTAPATGPAM